MKAKTIEAYKETLSACLLRLMKKHPKSLHLFRLIGLVPEESSIDYFTIRFRPDLVSSLTLKPDTGEGDSTMTDENVLQWSMDLLVLQIAGLNEELDIIKKELK